MPSLYYSHDFEPAFQHDASGSRCAMTFDKPHHSYKQVATMKQFRIDQIETSDEVQFRQSTVLETLQVELEEQLEADMRKQVKATPLGFSWNQRTPIHALQAMRSNIPSANDEHPPQVLNASHWQHPLFQVRTRHGAPSFNPRDS
jgi:hypothetical protein